MKINNIRLTNFRNIKNCQLDVSHKHVILKGENAQGKTNILEAVYLLCYGSSFRTQNLKEAIKYSDDYFYLKSEFEDDQSFFRSTEISFSQQKKTISVDGKEIKDRKELIYSLPCIVFSHDDIEFVRGEPEFRRRFFDQTMTMYDPVFFDDLRMYKQVLRQRNSAIKDERYELLDIYDEKLASYGLPLMEARSNVNKFFSDMFSDMYNSVSLDNKKICINYRPSWNTGLNIADTVDKLKAQREIDIAMKTTTSGPHRDRFVISDENGIFINGASTGQMRLASLIFRSVQAEFYRKKTSRNPIFLIDDVLLELDAEKRGRYLNLIGDYNQAFFTFLPQEKYFGTSFELNESDSVIYNVVNGEFFNERN